MNTITGKAAALAVSCGVCSDWALIATSIMVTTITAISMKSISTMLTATATMVMTIHTHIPMTIMDTITAMATTILIRMGIMGTIIRTRIPTRRGNSSPTRRSTATTSFSDWP